MERYLYAMIGRMVTVVQQQAAAHFTCGVTHNRVRARVVIGLAAKHLGSERPLLKHVGVARERGLDNVTKQGRIALAVAELRAAQHRLQLCANGSRFLGVERSESAVIGVQYFHATVNNKPAQRPCASRREVCNPS